MTAVDHRARSYAVTSWCHDPTCGLSDSLDGLPRGMRYLVYQKEIAPSTGSLHWQVYVYYNNPKTMAEVKGFFGQMAHVEIARGSVRENLTYVSKSQSAVPGTFVELGDIPNQGLRTDLQDVIKAIKDGNHSLLELYEEFPSQCAKYQRFIEKLYLMHNRQQTYEPRIMFLISGPPGCGKTSLVANTFVYSRVYDYDWHQKWFDLYDHEPVILMDEFDPHQFDVNLFKKLADGHPLRKEIKGGHVNVLAKVIIVCTNCPPEVLKTWIVHTPGIERRITYWLDCYEDAPEELCGPGHPYFEKNRKILKSVCLKNGVSSSCFQEDVSSPTCKQVSCD